jgi:hypothetical protein
MLWHAFTGPQRRQPRGEAGVALNGQPAFATGGTTLTRDRWRT